MKPPPPPDPPPAGWAIAEIRSPFQPIPPRYDDQTTYEIVTWQTRRNRLLVIPPRFVSEINVKHPECITMTIGEFGAWPRWNRAWSTNAAERHIHRIRRHDDLAESTKWTRCV